MCRISVLFSAVFVVLSFSGSLSAQVVDAALSEAKARLACGTGTVVSVQRLASGALQVTCSQNQVTTQSTVLDGTGLTPSVAVGAAVGLGVLAIVAGDSDDASTTTATTTGSGGSY